MGDCELMRQNCSIDNQKAKLLGLVKALLRPCVETGEEVLADEQGCLSSQSSIRITWLLLSDCSNEILPPG